MKYKPEFCTLLERHLSGGFSLRSFARKSNLHECTIYEWFKKKPDFYKAKVNGLKWAKTGLTGPQREALFKSESLLLRGEVNGDDNF